MKRSNSDRKQEQQHQEGGARRQRKETLAFKNGSRGTRPMLVTPERRSLSLEDALGVFERDFPEFVDRIDEFVAERLSDDRLKKKNPSRQRPSQREPSAGGRCDLDDETLDALASVRDFGLELQALTLRAESFACMAYPAFSYGESGETTVVSGMHRHLQSVYESGSEAATALTQHYGNLKDMFVGVKGRRVDVVDIIVDHAIQELTLLAFEDARLTLQALRNGVLELLNFLERNAESLRKVGLVSSSSSSRSSPSNE